MICAKETSPGLIALVKKEKNNLFSAVWYSDKTTFFSLETANVKTFKQSLVE